MNTPAALPPSSADLPLRGHFVLLRANSLRLLLPQHDVGPIEHLLSLPTASGTSGLLRREAPDERYFVALSEHLIPLPECPTDRFVATPLITEDEDSLHWCWSEVNIMINAELNASLLPEVLRAPYTPITHYVPREDGLAFLCTAQRLRDFIRSQGI